MESSVVTLAGDFVVRAGDRRRNLRYPLHYTQLKSGMVWNVRQCWLMVGAALLLATPALAGGFEWQPGAAAAVTFHLHHPLHDVTATAKEIRFLKPLRLDPAHVPAAVTTVRDLPVQVPWSAFDSGNPNRDANMLLAVRAEAFPLATFVVEQVAVTAATAERRWQGSMSGRLYLAGRKQPVTATFDLDATDSDRPHVRARFTVDMRRFGIAPPRLLMLAADPVVQVQVDLPLQLVSAGVRATTEAFGVPPSRDPLSERLRVDR